jgi:hypothetical protein
MGAHVRAMGKRVEFIHKFGRVGASAQETGHSARFLAVAALHLRMWACACVAGSG